MHGSEGRTLVIDVGGTKFTIAVFEGDRILLRETRRTDRRGGPAALVATLKNVWNAWNARERLIVGRVGIGFGGPVDFPTQTVTLSTHVSGWNEYPLVANISKMIGGASVVMDNDANVGALGEYCYGAGCGCSSLFYVTLSTGIGGGIIVGGEPVRGADSYAGELGHMNVVPDGPECLCGARGCLERMCCGLWLEQDYGKPADELLRDPEFVRNYVVLLARGLKSVLMLLNPERIVIGGGISKAGDSLFVPLREELNRQMTPWSRARRDIVPAQLADDSVLYGARALAVQEV